MPRKSALNIIVVPQIGPNDTEVTIVEWHVKDGDAVKKSDIIISLETAKAITDIESQYTGNIVTLQNEGQILAIGEKLAFIGNDLKKLAEEKKKYISLQSSKKDIKNIATKKAIQLAKKLNVRLDDINKEGIIKSDDVEEYHNSTQEKSNLEKNDKRLELSEYQKEIIKTISWQKENAIVGYIEKIIDIKPAKKYSEKMKKDKQWLFDPFFAIMAFRFVQCIKTHNSFNASINDGKHYNYKQINLGITIDVEDKLLISVFSGADSYNEIDFIENLFSLQKRTVNGDLKPNEMQKPTIGITSLSSYGVSRHIPILLPNTSIMIALSDKLPFGNKNSIYCVFGVTYDHRLHTGVQISKLLNSFQRSISKNLDTLND